MPSEITLYLYGVTVLMCLVAMFATCKEIAVRNRLEHALHAEKMYVAYIHRQLNARDRLLHPFIQHMRAPFGPAEE